MVFGVCLQIGDDKLTVLEVGCGVGNFMFPLLAEVKNTFFYACDFSPRAVQFVKVCTDMIIYKGLNILMNMYAYMFMHRYIV